MRILLITLSNHIARNPLCMLVTLRFFGRDKTRVDCAMNRIISELNRCGLLTYEHTPAATHCDLLGMHIDGDRKEIHMTAKRFRRIKWALKWVLRKRKVRGRTLERIIGHTTFAALLNCNVLSVTHTEYKLISKHYEHPSLIWNSVRREVENVRSFAFTPMLFRSQMAQRNVGSRCLRERIWCSHCKVDSKSCSTQWPNQRAK